MNADEARANSRFPNTTFKEQPQDFNNEGFDDPPQRRRQQEAQPSDPFEADRQRALNRFPESMQKSELNARENQAREQSGRDSYHREMKNIEEHGPLDKLTEMVLPENLSPEARETIENFQRMAEAGDYEGMAESVDSIGLQYNQRGFVQGYFESIKSSDDPAWQQDMAKLFNRYLVLMASRKR